MALSLIPEADFALAAKQLGCSIGAVKAVNEVEAGGKSGFLPDGQVVILFEPHIFSRYTQHKYDKSHPRISSRKWNKSLYGATGQNQHNKLAQAVALDRDAALMACSWGAFQIMGFNWKTCGYASLQKFITDMHTAAGQFRGFVGYVKTRGLADELQRLDAAGFAEGYNGDGYAANKYDVKIAAAFKKYGAVRTA